MGKLKEEKRTKSVQKTREIECKRRDIIMSKK